jgi:hypothetical protein
VDVDHQPTDLAVGVRIPRGAHQSPRSAAWGCLLICPAVSPALSERTNGYRRPLVGHHRPRPNRHPVCRGAGRAGCGAGAVAPRRAAQRDRAGRVPQRPGLLLRMWSAHPGGPLGAGAGPDPVRRLRPARSSPRTTEPVDTYASTPELYAPGRGWSAGRRVASSPGGCRCAEGESRVWRTVTGAVTFPRRSPGTMTASHRRRTMAIQRDVSDGQSRGGSDSSATATRRSP